MSKTYKIKSLYTYRPFGSSKSETYTQIGDLVPYYYFDEKGSRHHLGYIVSSEPVGNDPNNYPMCFAGRPMLNPYGRVCKDSMELKLGGQYDVQGMTYYPVPHGSYYKRRDYIISYAKAHPNSDVAKRLDAYLYSKSGKNVLDDPLWQNMD